MRVEFIACFRRANKRGTGFFYIPKNKEGGFSLGDRVRVELSDSENYFFARIVRDGIRLGIYTPKNITSRYNLLDQETKVKLSKMNGFFSKISVDGRIYIPQDIVKKYKLKQNDIVLIKGIEENKIITKKYSKINVNHRKGGRKKEYTCVFDKNLYNNPLVFQIKKGTRHKNWEISPLIKKAISNAYYSFINKNSLIVFQGSKVPIVVPTKLRYSDVAFYLGCYFADGTKKGNSWAICASTFAQAKYYQKMHNLLIKDSRMVELVVSYTNIADIDYDKITKRLAKLWQDKTGITIQKFRIRKPTGKYVKHRKHNKYGTLIMREHRQIILDFYNVLLKSLIHYIISTNNQELALNFICGAAEGDGCAPATQRGHIVIWSNRHQIHTLKTILELTQMKFKIGQDTPNKYFIRITALGLLKNFEYIGDRIFNLYPKRRKLFFERFKTVGAVRFLMVNHEPCSWVKAWLKNNGLADENYKITQKGLELKKILQSRSLK